MHRFFAGRICLGLIAFGCGSPGDLDQSRFPELEDTGYPDRVGAAGAGGALGGAGGSNAGGSNPGGSNSGGGGGIIGTGGTAPSGGSGGSPGVSGNGGQPSSGGTGTGQGGTGAQPAACPDDITVLTNRPGAEGGCNGPACHIPGATTPDLISPGIEARLVNVVSTNCGSRPYIGADDSLLEEKIVGPTTCGFPMPFGDDDKLNEADKACIVEWIDELQAGL